MFKTKAFSNNLFKIIGKSQLDSLTLINQDGAEWLYKIWPYASMGSRTKNLKFWLNLLWKRTRISFNCCCSTGIKCCYCPLCQRMEVIHLSCPALFPKTWQYNQRGRNSSLLQLAAVHMESVCSAFRTLFVGLDDMSLPWIGYIWALFRTRI